MTITKFSFPTDIHFGPGAGRPWASTCAGVDSPPSLSLTECLRFAGLNKFIGSLGAGLDVPLFQWRAWQSHRFAGMQGRDAFRTHRADCVIGIGGGAALDVAKVVALMAVHDGDVIEYAWDHPQVRAIVRELPYFVAVPTTSGTGSEVGRSSVVSDDTTHVKQVIFSPKLLAKAVFADRS